MSNEEIATLVDEVLKEFLITPYYDDDQLINLIKEGEYTVGRLNPGCSITTDLTYRMLLKNYEYYANHHRVSEFMNNYSSVILTWQMETEVSANGNA